MKQRRGAVSVRDETWGVIAQIPFQARHRYDGRDRYSDPSSMYACQWKPYLMASVSSP
jgi:hypothetical protein